MGVIVAVIGVLLLAAHLLAMNVPSSAPLVCIWLHARGRRGDVAADTVGRQLALVSLWSLLAGTLLGAALIAFLWAIGDGGYWHAVQRFPIQAYGVAFAELAFTVACLAVYVFTWERWRVRPWLHALVAVLATTNLLYHFPPLMIALGNLASRPELAQEELITRPVFRGLLLRPDLLAQVLHFVVASAAVGGVALMLLADRRRAAEDQAAAVGGLIAAGGRIALAASLIQLAVGVWVLVQLPGASRWALLGDDWIAGGMFFLAVLAAFGMLYALAGVALGDTRTIAIRRAAVLMLLVVLFMTAALTRSRRIEEFDGGLAQKKVLWEASLTPIARCLTICCEAAIRHRGRRPLPQRFLGEAFDGGTIEQLTGIQ